MTRARAQAAVDEAFADGMKMMFAVLVNNVVNKNEDALARFKTGIAAHDAAHALASAAIETIFPE